jgi:hypothetical protein
LADRSASIHCVIQGYPTGRVVRATPKSHSTRSAYPPGSACECGRKKVSRVRHRRIAKMASFNQAGRQCKARTSLPPLLDEIQVVYSAYNYVSCTSTVYRSTYSSVSWTKSSIHSSTVSSAPPDSALSNSLPRAFRSESNLSTFLFRQAFHSATSRSR